MALIGAKLKQDMEAAILGALTKAYPTESIADPSSHKKLAGAIAEGVALILVIALQTEAEVLPGIATVGAPNAHVSVTPGKIF